MALAYLDADLLIVFALDGLDTPPYLVFYASLHLLYAL